MLTIAAAVAIRAADEDVAEELHLDLLKPCAAAFLALADARLKLKALAFRRCWRFRIAQRLRRMSSKKICRRYVNGGIKAQGFAERGLIHEDDLPGGFRSH